MGKNMLLLIKLYHKRVTSFHLISSNESVYSTGWDQTGAAMAIRIVLPNKAVQTG